MSILKRSISGSLLGIITFLITIIQNVFFVPIILSNWTKEDYGLWLSSYFFINLLRTIDAGHQIYVGNEFSSLFLTNSEKAKILLGSSIKIALLIGFFELLIFIFIVLFHLDFYIFGNNIDSKLIIGITGMLIMWFLVGSVGGILVRIIIPLGHFTKSAGWAIVNKIVEIIVILVAVLLNWPVSTTLIILAIAMFVYSIIVIIDIKFVSKEYYPWWQYGSFLEGFKNFKKSLLVTLNNFLEQFSTNGLIILISNILSVAWVPIFSTLKTVSNSFVTINQITLNPISADIIRYHTTGQKDKIAYIININWFFLAIILFIPIIILLPNLEFLFNLWTKNKLVFESTFAYYLVFSIVLISFGKILVNYLININHLQSLLIINISRFIILIPICIWSLNYYQSIKPLGICICISEAFASILLPLYFLKKELTNNFKLINLIIPFLMFLVSLIFILLLNFNIVIPVVQIIFVILFVFLLFFNFQLLPLNFKNQLLTFKINS